MQQEQAEAIASHADKFVIGGAVGSVYFGFTVQELGVWVGILVAVAGLFISWYYKHKAYQMKRAMYDKLLEDDDDAD